MKYDVISIGSATQDVLISAEDFTLVKDASFEVGQGICLPFGSKIQVENITFASGGGGTNAAVTFARQGLRTAGIGVIGEDANASALLDELRREGVDAKYFQTNSADMTAYSVVLVSKNGERTILSYKGVGTHWDVKRIPWDQLETKWAYINSLGGSMEMLESITHWATQKRVHLATNPGPQELKLGLEKLAPLWKHFDIVGMNQEEAATLTGLPYADEARLFAAMDEAIGGIFIMTKGSEGVTVSDGHAMYSAGIPNSEVLERTGAGDAFHAAFLTEFMRSGSIEKAIQLGTANASSVVLHYGAKKGILRHDEKSSIPLVTVLKRSLK
jgi:sugar/nucleoside kinase (ribokinase family)